MKKCWMMGIVGLVLFADCTNVCAQNQPVEQVYLQTDKGIYETGEDLWFKSYVLDRSSLSLSGKKNIRYKPALPTVTFI